MIAIHKAIIITAIFLIRKKAKSCETSATNNAIKAIIIKMSDILLNTRLIKDIKTLITKIINEKATMYIPMTGEKAHRANPKVIVTMLNKPSLKKNLAFVILFLKIIINVITIRKKDIPKTKKPMLVKGTKPSNLSAISIR